MRRWLKGAAKKSLLRLSYKRGYFGLLIYTIGHSTRSLEELVELLKKYGVETVVDIRRFPVSRKFPRFNRENMEKHFLAKGIRYIWMGDSLGGYRSGGYRKYMETKEFKNGIDKLLEIASESVTSIMCAEIVWFRCHRKFVSDELTRRNVKVIHIVDGKKSYVHVTREKGEK